MSRNEVEDRLRDALGAIRDQSTAAPPFDDLDPERRSREALQTGPRRRTNPILLAAAAVIAVVAIAGAVLLGGGSDDTTETADSPDAIGHDELVARVVDECLAFQAAAPAAALPGVGPEATPDEVEALRTWQEQYLAALDGADDMFLDAVPTDRDREWVDDSLALLRAQQDHARRAGQALDDGDPVDAHQALLVSIQYGNQLSFQLAQAGAPECDARGVTQPTR